MGALRMAVISQNAEKHDFLANLTGISGEMEIKI
jgi:hypothetical protein